MGGTVAGSRSMGGTASVHLALKVQSILSTKSSTLPFVPLAQPDVNSVILSLKDPSLDPSVPPPTTSSSLVAAVVAIKDKAANLGLKDITDKDSWINAKKIIYARLRCPPYCPGPDSKALIPTKDNQVASCWWEEVLNYYVKPPISDLLVEESWFDEKGFEMIKHIDEYLNPSGAVDSLGYIFDFINVKQASDESVITPKTWLSCLLHLSNWGHCH
jgi:hypothetical protein